ncbi:hypothetical protein FPZ24_03090 [Sphingomonas panacisoli]|uniref:DUF3558 domain-containing protein n=1 Tax=Sphingomonas panacisoli TaxID=1813879 RepID=A0A5B8LET6_9SPHN|nr:hypothetical protein [Sphingomonas panacisoli]QDZ06583.1 hypothetical protein FPZ24_03090 [Sphingomonas panacisoli]
MTGIVARSFAAVTLAGLTASCGGGGLAGGGSQKAADWALDACKTFPKEAAGKAAGVAVGKTETAGQTGNDDILVSNCTYSSADGKTNFGVLLRQVKTGGQSVDAQIADMKSRPDMTGPSEDVAMPKGKAVWASKMHTLSYVPADGRMIVVTPPGAFSFGGPASADGDLKAKAIAIASAVEG